MIAPQTFTEHAGVTLRMLWACCAADNASPLSCTQRAAIWESLKNHAWYPHVDALPQTAAVVAKWYATIEGPGMAMMMTLATRKKTPDAL